MGFQLVSATDDEIVVWHTDHGHIFLFQIPPRAAALTPIWFKDIPDAAATAESLQAEAIAFATQEARVRRLLA